MPQCPIQGIRIRWPELETGANSVTPWVMPSTIACRMFVAPSRPSPGQRTLASALEQGNARRTLSSFLHNALSREAERNRHPKSRVSPYCQLVAEAIAPSTSTTQRRTGSRRIVGGGWLLARALAGPALIVGAV